MVVAPAIDLDAEHRQTVMTLLSRYLPNTTVWAYGSRVKWTSHPASDLDLVAFTKPDQAARVAELREAFDDSNLPFGVDLFVWDGVPSGFRKRIEAEYVVLAKKVRSVREKRKGWPEVTLGDCIKMNDATYSPKESWPFVNYLDTGNITENRIGEIHHLIPGKDKIPSRARRKAQPGDILYSTVRPNQRHFGLLKKVPKNFLASTGFSVIRGKEDCARTDFIYWFLAQDSVVEHLQTIAEHSTSAYPSIRPVDIERLSLNLPPLSEQRAITRILGVLDDKIQLNRCMNETLGRMTRALLKSWFVDFDPVRAKMEGRDAGLPQDIATLFPNQLAESELGKIPKGWRIGSIADVATSPRRTAKPSELPHELPYIGLEHMPRQSIALTDWGQAGKVKSGKSKFDKGNILFGKLRPYFHKVGVAPLNGVCSTDIMVIAPKKPQWAAFLLAWVSSTEFVAYANQASTGTKMPRTNWKVMSDYRLCLPPEQTVCAFQSLVQPMLDRIIANIHESRALALQRDALLPKLVSGDVQVSPSNDR